MYLNNQNIIPVLPPLRPDGGEEVKKVWLAEAVAAVKAQLEKKKRE
jgi:hypothetical protein